jgi:hypothetical protein
MNTEGKGPKLEGLMPTELHTASEWEAIKKRQKEEKAHAFLMAALRLTSDALRLDPDLTPLDTALADMLKAKSISTRKSVA